VTSEGWKLRGEAGTKTDHLRARESTQNMKKKPTMLYKFLEIVSPTSQNLYGSA
jgi:hypothetical protein